MSTDNIVYIRCHKITHIASMSKTFTGHPDTPKDIFWIPSGHLLDMHAMWIHIIH